MNKGKKEELQELSRELKKLCLQQEKLEDKQRETGRALQANREAIGKLAYKLNERGTPPPTPQRELVDRSKIHQGDKVRIKAPSKGQEETGEAFGVTRVNLIKVRTENNTVIRRLPKNLAKLN